MENSKTTIKDLKNNLLKNFIEDISDYFVKNDNELYLDINPEKILEISTYVHHQLGFPLVSLFANDEQIMIDAYAVYYVFADEAHSILLIIKTRVSPKKMEIPSISKKVYAAALYEREIHDLFGIHPVDHPDPKRLLFHSNWPQNNFPLRKSFDGKFQPPFAKEEISFHQVIGDGVYEIPVGPVHAGIIEPGHFRFSVEGEPIIYFEAQLYFVHKGIEKLSEGQSIEKGLYLSERISGDETFANSLAYCQAIEKIAKVKVPLRAKFTRLIFAELERLTSHLGDLGGLCLDTAYGFSTYQFRMMKGWAYGIADELCGMRFLRSVNKMGGVRKDFLAGKEASIIAKLKRLEKELRDTAEFVHSNTMFLDRLENIGILKPDAARDLHAVGPAGRASGISHDVRKDFPYEAYPHLEYRIPGYQEGDINCRMDQKLEECFESINLMLHAISEMPKGDIWEPITSVPPGHFAFGMVEAPRGENIHWVMTGKSNTIFRYKIRTPSFCNWPALCQAVRGNIVPDFPLINKSFNLSYAGNDL